MKKIMKETIKVIIELIVSIAIFIGIFWGIAFVISKVDPPAEKRGGIYPEQDCTPNYMGGCN